MQEELSGVRSLEGFRSLGGSTSIAMEAASPRPSTDTGEKLAEEQASVKIDLEMEHVKLRGTTEATNLLEGKLQQDVNENAKLKVKQTEGSRQLTETLQDEEDKKPFEYMLGKNSKDLDEFNCLEDAEQKIISGRQEVLQINQDKKDIDQSYKERLYSDDTTRKEKDSLIKQLEGSFDKNKSRLICLDSHLQCMEQELKLNNNVCVSLKENLANSESEKNSLELLMNKGHILEIQKLRQDSKDLRELLSSFMVKVTELDKEHASVSSHVPWLISSFERLYEMAQEEKMPMARSSKDKFEHLRSQYADWIAQNSSLKTEIEELISRLIESQLTQEIVMVQLVEECQVAEDKIRRLESEAEVSASSINQFEKLASELQGRIQKLLEDSILAENHKQILLQNILKLESDNQEILGQVQCIMEEKSNTTGSLQGEITKRDQQVNTLENQNNQLRSILDEKEQLCRCSVKREKTLEDQKLQVEALLSAKECQLSEAKKQYDLMLEGEKIELSKHLKELCLKHDQVINEICTKHELEKIEITNAEKEKAENLINEIENKCNEKISQNKYDSERYLIWLKEEHGAMVARIQQDYEHKESTLLAYHKEELQHIQSHAEIDLRKRISLLRKEHELELKSLRMHHEQECQRMQEELELQKSKLDDNVWDKRQIMYVLVLGTTATLVFLLQPLLPVAYGRWIILVIGAMWGLGSIGLPFGLYGTTRCEKEFSRYTSRLVYTLFSVMVIYGFYLVAMRIDTSSTSSSTSPPSLNEGADINSDTNWWWTFWFCAIGLVVLIGNIGSSVWGCWTGGDKDT